MIISALHPVQKHKIPWHRTVFSFALLIWASDRIYLWHGCCFLVPFSIYWKWCGKEPSLLKQAVWIATVLYVVNLDTADKIMEEKNAVNSVERRTSTGEWLCLWLLDVCRRCTPLENGNVCFELQRGSSGLLGEKWEWICFIWTGMFNFLSSSSS